MSRQDPMEWQIPLPPKPRRRAPLELYEWLLVLSFILVLGMALGVHIDSSKEKSYWDWDNPVNLLITLYSIAGLIFILMVIFDRASMKRYRNYSEDIFEQWKEDKLRFMKMNADMMMGTSIPRPPPAPFPPPPPEETNAGEDQGEE